MSWDCNECRSSGLFEQRGCQPGGKALVTINTKSGEKFDRCPKAWLNQDVGHLVDLISDHSWLKKYGVMPRPGGKLDQSSRFVDACNIIDSISSGVADGN